MHVPAVRADELPHDRQPEPGPALVAAARVVEPGEPFEDALPVGGRHAGAVVRHGEQDVPAGPCSRSPPPGCARTDGVLHEVDDDALEHVIARRTAIAPQPSRVTRTERPRCRSSRSTTRSATAARSPWRATGPPGLAGVVEPGEQQQVVDEPAHPGGVLEDVVGRGPPVAPPSRRARLRAGQPGHLDGRADRGQRAAQLVRGVRDERPLPRAAASSRASMPLRVTARRRISSSAAGSGRVPAPPAGAEGGARVAGEGLHRPERGSDEPPAEQRRAGHEHEAHDDHRLLDHDDAALDVRDGSGHEDGLRAVRSRPDADHAQDVARRPAGGRRARRRRRPGRARRPRARAAGPAGHPPARPRQPGPHRRGPGRWSSRRWARHRAAGRRSPGRRRRGPGRERRRRAGPQGAGGRQGRDGRAGERVQQDERPAADPDGRAAPPADRDRPIGEPDRRGVRLGPGSPGAAAGRRRDVARGLRAEYGTIVLSGRDGAEAEAGELDPGASRRRGAAAEKARARDDRGRPRGRRLLRAGEPAAAARASRREPWG